jgi:glutaminyl-tRNA synthetase
VVAVHCEYDPETRSGSAGADKIKVKGNIHWVSARHACVAEVRLYDRLFKSENPGSADDLLTELNPASRTVITAQLEPALRNAAPETRFQFERHGYFVADAKDMSRARPVFNRTVTLRDSWARGTP